MGPLLWREYAQPVNIAITDNNERKFDQVEALAVLEDDSVGGQERHKRIYAHTYSRGECTQSQGEGLTAQLVEGPSDGAGNPLKQDRTDRKNNPVQEQPSHTEHASQVQPPQDTVEGVSAGQIDEQHDTADLAAH